MEKVLTVFAVILTYKDGSQDLDDIFPTPESAILAAKNIINHSADVISVVVDEDVVTEIYGRIWKKTIFRKTREED